MNLPRLLRTLSHLKTRQIVGQVRHRLRKAIEDPQKFAAQAIPPFPGVRWSPAEAFVSPVPEHEAWQQGCFTFINRTESLGSPIDWQKPGLPKLWLYNLHYFDYLWPMSFSDARAIALDWIARHPLGKGAVGWEPYPTSLRLMNFCCLFFHRWRNETEHDRSFCDALWHGMHLQAEWLLSHLETHLLGNHYLENAAALTVAGNCFGNSRWTKVGRSILEEQLDEQILPDGGHFERSPMYHARVVYLLKMLWNIGVMDILPMLQDAERFVAAMTHPDGNIALLNDAALGVYCTEPVPLHPGVFPYPDTGYFAARTPDGHYLLCDAAPIGPDYLPGHAHADIFTFELSLFGQRVIVDSGTTDYEISDTRKFTRSTAAHNTVEIAGQDQCEMWAAFRVGRRGHPRDVAFEKLDDGFRLSGWHDGYRHLKGSPIHRRTFRFEFGGAITVEDLVESGAPHPVVSRLHLHPSVRAKLVSPLEVELSFPRGKAQVLFTGEGNLRIQPSLYYPEFSKVENNTTLVFDWSGRGHFGFVIRPRD